MPCAIVSILWMAFMGTVFLFPTSPTTDVADMNYTVVRTPKASVSLGRRLIVDYLSQVVLGGVMILSLVWYYFPVYGGVHWFTGPIPTIDKAGSTTAESGRPSTSDSLEKKNQASVGQQEV